MSGWMRTTTKPINGLSFHGTRIRTRISRLIDLLGEPAGGHDYGRDPMLWRAETSKGDVFCIYKEAGSARYRRRQWVVFQVLAKDAMAAERAKEEVEENLEGQGDNQGVNRQSKKGH